MILLKIKKQKTLKEHGRLNLFCRKLIAFLLECKQDEINWHCYISFK